MKERGTCDLCGAKFNMKKANQRFCSLECGKISKKKERDESLKKYEVKCKACGNFFTSTRRTQKYCKKCTTHARQFLIFARDGFKCQYCGRTVKDGAILQVDHIYPVSRGGDNSIQNLITSCSKCNLSKNNYLMPKQLIFKYWEYTSNRNKGFKELMREFQREYRKGTPNNALAGDFDGAGRFSG